MCLDALNAIPKIPALFVLILWKRYKKKISLTFETIQQKWLCWCLNSSNKRPRKSSSLCFTFWNNFVEKTQPEWPFSLKLETYLEGAAVTMLRNDCNVCHMIFRGTCSPEDFKLGEILPLILVCFSSFGFSGGFCPQNVLLWHCLEQL